MFYMSKRNGTTSAQLLFHKEAHEKRKRHYKIGNKRTEVYFYYKRLFCGKQQKEKEQVSVWCYC